MSNSEIPDNQRLTQNISYDTLVTAVNSNLNINLISIDGLRDNGTLQCFLQTSMARQLSISTSQVSQCGRVNELSPYFQNPPNASINPQSLFLQALTKLTERTPVILNLDSMQNPTQLIVNNLEKNTRSKVTKDNVTETLTPDLSAPSSLTSAPPSYSFVLRQMNARRRPRFMGTFIPSPSFIQHTPPPNYAQAFDIYVDNPLPQAQPPRTFNFGFHPMVAMCPECGYTGVTTVNSKVTFCTHFCALTLCLFSSWLCVPLPYILSSCKNVYHYCGNCRYYLGVYYPTNPHAI